MRTMLEPGTGTFELRRRRHTVQRAPIVQRSARRVAATRPATAASATPTPNEKPVKPA